MEEYVYTSLRARPELVESRPGDYVTKWLGSDERAAGIPVLRIDGTLPPEENVRRITDHMNARK